MSSLISIYPLNYSHNLYSSMKNIINSIVIIKTYFPIENILFKSFLVFNKLEFAAQVHTKI